VPTAAPLGLRARRGDRCVLVSGRRSRSWYGTRMPGRITRAEAAGEPAAERIPGAVQRFTGRGIAAENLKRIEAADIAFRIAGR
jgi:hypothetical protein